MLRLVSTDIHNNEVSLTANEFNSLRILFKVEDAKSLASLTPFFTQSTHSSTKVHMNELQDWILEQLDQNEPEQFNLSHLNKCVVVKDRSFAEGSDVRIEKCDDSYIYIN